MHPGLPAPIERRPRRLGEVREELSGAGGVRHRHRRHAVLEHVHPARQRAIARLDPAHQILDRVLDAVARRLPRDHQPIGGHQRLREVRRRRAERRAVVGGRDLRRQHRVVLGQHAGALDLDRGRRVARVGVKQPRFLDHADHAVAAAADQTVRRPQIELVAPPPLELLAVVEHLAPQPGVVAAGDPRASSGRGRTSPLAISAAATVRCAASGSPSRPIQNDGEKMWCGR